MAPVLAAAAGSSGGGAIPSIVNTATNTAAAPMLGTAGALETAYGWYLQKHNPRPEYSIAPAATTSLNLSREQAMRGLDSSTIEANQVANDRNNAFALSNTSSRGGGLSTVAGINQNSFDNNLKLASIDAQMRRENQMNYANALNAYADRQDQAWDMNFYRPYMYKQALANDYMRTGSQDMKGAVVMGAGSSRATGDSGYTKQPTEAPPYNGAQTTLSPKGTTLTYVPSTSSAEQNIFSNVAYR